MDYLKISEDYPKSCKRFINWISSDFNENRVLDLFYYHFFYKKIGWKFKEDMIPTHSWLKI